MVQRVRAIHSRYGEELETVGRLLVEYGELELGLMNCVAVTQANPFDQVFKTMFATRGEKKRIDEAKKLGLPEYSRQGFKADFDEAIEAMDHCRLVRNQYAHCQWHNPGDGLCFVDLESLAQAPQAIADLSDAPFRYVNQALLDEQEDYFTYAELCITFVNYARRALLGQPAMNISRPNKKTKPRFYL